MPPFNTIRCQPALLFALYYGRLTDIQWISHSMEIIMLLFLKFSCIPNFRSCHDFVVGRLLYHFQLRLCAAETSAPSTHFIHHVDVYVGLWSPVDECDQLPKDVDTRASVVLNILALLSGICILS